MGLLDPNDDDKSNALNMGLLTAGLGILANNTSKNPMQAIARGSMGGLDAYQMALAQAQKQKLQQLQMREFERKQQAMMQIREQLPEQMRPIFDANPESVLSMMNKEQKRHVVGNALVDDAGSVLYQGPAKEGSPTGLAKLIAERDALPPGHPARRTYDAAINKETNFAPPMVVQNYPNPVPVIGPDNKPVLAQFGNKGDVKMTGLTPAPEAKPPTEGEAKAAFFVSNMKAASRVLDKLENEGMNMSSIGTQTATALSGGVGNLVTSPRAQQARQAQNQWAEQMLRMQTGAAATTDEVARTVSTYFPQIGDSEEVVTQKREMRKQAENGVFAASGRAQDRVPGGSEGGKVRKYNPATGRIE
jgi:hypothetical protein